MEFLRIFVLTSLFVTGTRESCRKVDARRAISYKLLKSEVKSVKSVMTRRRIGSVDKCMDFAESKQALAFNFGRYSTNDSREGNCILLYCPETNIRELVNATGIDYYTAYSNNNTLNESLNIFCVEKIGMFLLFIEKENYTNARAACRKNHGILADVTSEERTRGLSSMIGNALVYVGLRSEGNERIWRNEFGDPMSCFDYRSWDVGEPSHSRGCVGLFRLDTKMEPIWKVVPCNTELPYLCEISRSTNESDLLKRSFILPVHL